jgi:hypothetical protein
MNSNFLLLIKALDLNPDKGRGEETATNQVARMLELVTCFADYFKTLATYKVPFFELSISSQSHIEFKVDSLEIGACFEISCAYMRPGYCLILWGTGSKYPAPWGRFETPDAVLQAYINAEQHLLEGRAVYNLDFFKI